MLRRHPDQCQNCKYLTRHIHVSLAWTLKIFVYIVPVTVQLGQKKSEIASLKLEISGLRKQMAQAAEVQELHWSAVGFVMWLKCWSGF